MSIKRILSVAGFLALFGLAGQANAETAYAYGSAAQPEKPVRTDTAKPQPDKKLAEQKPKQELKYDLNTRLGWYALDFNSNQGSATINIFPAKLEYKPNDKITLGLNAAVNVSHTAHETKNETLENNFTSFTFGPSFEAESADGRIKFFYLFNSTDPRTAALRNKRKSSNYVEFDLDPNLGKDIYAIIAASNTFTNQDRIINGAAGLAVRNLFVNGLTGYTRLEHEVDSFMEDSLTYLRPGLTYKKDKLRFDARGYAGQRAGVGTQLDFRIEDRISVSGFLDVRFDNGKEDRNETVGGFTLTVTR